jgi:SNF2 family DNA or RNA helicase
MGLGKTVEVIALALLRPPPVSGPWAADAQRGATLIVTPPHILQQWRSEVSLLHLLHLSVRG